MARARVPFSPGFPPPREGILFHDDQEDESDRGLLSEKPSDSAGAYQYRHLLAFPPWVRELFNPARLPENVKYGASFGGRLSRKVIGTAAVICLIAIIAWTTSYGEHRHIPFLTSNPTSTPTTVEHSSSALHPASTPTSMPTSTDHSSWTSHNRPASRPPNDLSLGEEWTKPPGFQIVGIVFYGRRVHVDILDCYLRQNLVTNGGYLDGVLFFQNTDDEDDINYLAQLVAGERRYKRIDFGADVRDWKHMWAADFDENTMYFKIDDDLVYIHPTAIPQMVHTLLAHPEAHNVQANIVNSASTSWQHFHAGAVRPYLPEIVRPRGVNRTTWRPSELPSYPAESAEPQFDLEAPPPFSGHRWLPMDDVSAALMKTPIKQTENYAWGNDWTKWGIAAQHHYSLFSNIEQDTMDRYIFGNGEGLFNTQYERYKINLMGIWGSTINLARPQKDDEREFTEEIPRRLGMRKYIFCNSRRSVRAFMLIRV